MWSYCFSNNICRLCGCSSEENYNFDMACNLEIADSEDIATKIKRLIPINTEQPDRKPRQICYNCKNKLQDYDEFVSLCLSSDINFNNILENIGSEKPQEIRNNNGKCVVFVQSEKIIRNDIFQPPNSNVIVIDKTEPSAPQNVYLMLELDYKNISQTTENIEQLGFLNSHDISVETQCQIAVDESPQILNSQKLVRPNDSKVECVKDDIQKVKKFECNVCHKLLARKTNLMAHLALHSTTRPHKCDDCEKTFVTTWDMTVHRHIHTGTFTCQYCKKPFITKSKLERHLKSHTGVKEFVCSVCKKGFAEKNNMISHMSVHTGERPFNCQICKKSFRLQSHLTDHSKVHSSIAPFKCLTCNKSFKWKSNYKDHMKYHNGEKNKCVFCNMKCDSKSDFLKHRKSCIDLTVK